MEFVAGLNIMTLPMQCIVVFAFVNATGESRSREGTVLFNSKFMCKPEEEAERILSELKVKV
jgi:hypothetical protein